MLSCYLQESTPLLKLFESKMTFSKGSVVSLQSQLEATKQDLLSTQEVIAKNREKRANIPKRHVKFDALAKSLESDMAKIDDVIACQQGKMNILLPILSEPCPPLQPCFNLTSTDISQTNFCVKLSCLLLWLL